MQYTVTIADTGQTPYTGASVADDLTGVLDDAAYNGDASATAGSVSFATPALTWTGSLNPGDSATVTFSVTVNNPDTGNKVLSTVVTSAATGSNCPSGSTDARCAATVPWRRARPLLTITVTSDVPRFPDGGAGELHGDRQQRRGHPVYRGRLHRPARRACSTTRTYNGDASATVGSVAFSSPDLTWTGTLAAGATATITFSVTVNDPDTGNDILASSVTSGSTGANCAPG